MSVININQNYWTKYIADSAAKPGRVFGSKTSLGPIGFADLAYPVATHFPGPEETRSYVSHFLYALHDKRIVYGITSLKMGQSKTAWQLSKSRSYCMVDDSLQHMVRFGIGDEIRNLLGLDYDTTETEIEILSFYRKTQRSLQPV